MLNMRVQVLSVQLVVLASICIVPLMIPASGAYRNITGAQHAIHGAKPGEYSLIRQLISSLVLLFLRSLPV